MRSKISLHHACAMFAAGALLTVSGQSRGAAASGEPRALSAHVDAGYVMTDAATSDFLDDGWMLEAGLTWRPRGGPFGLRADLRLLEFDMDEDILQLGGSPSFPTRVDDGDARIVGLNLGATYDLEFADRGHVYVTAGLGPYYRDVELTQTVLFTGIACDAFFGICFQALAPGEVVVAQDDTTRLGWSVGLGVEYPLRQGALFMEARYLRIETDEPTELVPIQFGFRF